MALDLDFSAKGISRRWEADRKASFAEDEGKDEGRKEAFQEVLENLNKLSAEEFRAWLEAK